jgi:hypothetical protein
MNIFIFRATLHFHHLVLAVVFVSWRNCDNAIFVFEGLLPRVPAERSEESFVLVIRDVPVAGGSSEAYHQRLEEVQHFHHRITNSPAIDSIIIHSQEKLAGPIIRLHLIIKKQN